MVLQDRAQMKIDLEFSTIPTRGLDESSAKACNINISEGDPPPGADSTRVVTGILRNSGFVFLTQAIAMVSQLLIYSLIGKSWGPARFGQISFLIIFSQLFSFISSLGIGQILIREMAREPGKFQTYWRNAIGMWWIQTCVMCVTVILVGSLFVGKNVAWLLLLAGIYVALDSCRGLYRAVFYSMQRMEFETAMIFTQQGLALISIYIILQHDGGVLQVLMALAASRFLGILIYFLLVRVLLRRTPTPAIDRIIWTKLGKMSVPFALNELLTPIYMQSDVVLISLLLGDQITGVYRAASVLISPLAMIAVSLSSALYPVVSKTSQDRKVAQFAHESVKIMLAVSIPITVATIVLADRIIGVFYTEEFTASVVILQFLALLVPFRYASNALATILTSRNQQKLRTIAVAIGTVTGLVLNLVFIPVWGYFVVVVVAVMKDIIIMVLLSIYARKYFQITHCLRYLPKLLLGNAAFALFLLTFYNLKLLALISVSPILYLGILILTRFVSRKDWSLFKRTLTGRYK
jgi:O-antigen/teichoic acid export membrane protein